MKLFSHIFNSDSKSVTFGWSLSLAAHAFFVMLPDRFKVEHWSAAQAVAAGLIGIKSVKEGIIEAKEATNAAPAPAAAPVA